MVLVYQKISFSQRGICSPSCPQLINKSLGLCLFYFSLTQSIIKNDIPHRRGVGASRESSREAEAPDIEPSGYPL